MVLRIIKEQIIAIKRNQIIKRMREKFFTNNISIISQNCTGGLFYHDMGVKFLSPTINLFFYPADFMKFVYNLEYYLKIDPVMDSMDEYPIGRLDDIKIHFMHYDSWEQAKDAWNRRKERIDFSKMIIFCTDRDGFDDHTFRLWCDIPYKKVLFTANKLYGQHKDSIYFPEFESHGCVPDELLTHRLFYKEAKVIDAVNDLV